MRNPTTVESYMASIIKANPDETQRGWELAAWKAFEKDVAMRRAFFNYGVANYFKGHEIVTGENSIAIHKRARHYRKSARPRTRAARKAKAERQRTVIGLTMFNWIMDQRCGDLLKMGGAIGSLGKLGKPNQVLGHVVSTVDARSVLQRHGCDVPNVIAAKGPTKRAA